MTLSQFLEAFPGFLFVADAEGALLQCSEALVRRFGDRLEDASLSSLVVEEDRGAVEHMLRALGESEEPVRCELRVSEGEGEGEGEGEMVRLCCVARRSPEGSILGQLEPSSAAMGTPRIESALFQTIIETLDIAVWAVDDSGEFVFQDGKALAAIGQEPGQLVGQNVFELYPEETLVSVREALAGAASHNRAEAHGVHWDSWHVPLCNDAGEVEYCVGLTHDITKAVETKRQLEHQLDTIQRQQRAIHELSAPLIRVWDGVLTVPLIGLMDRERSEELGERLLTEVSQSDVRYTILDLTGVETLDTSIANHILRLLSSLRLLGVEGVITGISSRVAQTMTGLGIELGDIQTYRSLRDGLRHCMQGLRRAGQ